MILHVDLHDECDWVEETMILSIKWNKIKKERIYVLVTLMFSSAFLCANFNAINWVNWEQKQFNCYFAVTPDVHKLQFMILIRCDLYLFWVRRTLDFDLLSFRMGFCSIRGATLIDQSIHYIKYYQYWFSFGSTNWKQRFFHSKTICKWHHAIEMW